MAEVDVPEGYTSSISGSGTMFTITNRLTSEETPEVPDEPELPPAIDVNDSDVPTDYVEVEEPEVPMTDVPKTSDDSRTALWMLLAAMSALVLMGLAAAGRCVRE